MFYSGCNGRFFGPRACGLGKATIGRHAFAGYVADGGGGTLVSAPMMADTGRLLVTGSGAIRVGVMYDGALSAAASTIVNGTEVEVRWEPRWPSGRGAPWCSCSSWRRAARCMRFTCDFFNSLMWNEAQQNNNIIVL